MFERYSYIFVRVVERWEIKVSLLFTQSILFGWAEKICKVGGNFGFEVSHPTHTLHYQADAAQARCAAGVMLTTVNWYPWVGLAIAHRLA